MSKPDPASTISWGPHDSLLYAVSIGLGGDGASDLPFVYERDPAFAAFPTLPLGLTFRVGNGRPWTDPTLHALIAFSPLNLLHGEQRVEWLRPLPLPATFSGSVAARTIAVVPKGPKSVVVVAEQVLFAAVDGAPVCRMLSSMFLRDATVRPGALEKSPLKGVFDTAEARAIAASVTRRAALGAASSTTTTTFKYRVASNQAAIYRINGDDNPIHVDPVAAAKAKLPVPILHGLCTFGFAARALVSHFGATSLRSMGGRFANPVLPEDTLAVTIRESSATPSPGGADVSVMFDVVAFRGDGKKPFSVVTGDAVVAQKTKPASHL